LLLRAGDGAAGWRQSHEPLHHQLWRVLLLHEGCVRLCAAGLAPAAGRMCAACVPRQPRCCPKHVTRAGTTCRCSHAQGASCFGWVSQPPQQPDGLAAAAGEGVGVQGSQAQFVRVPLAEGTLIKVGALCASGGRATASLRPDTVNIGLNTPCAHPPTHTHTLTRARAHTHRRCPRA
jgi:hypothetical protein